MKKTIFSAADILLPDFDKNSEKWQGWSVIACDQFTSEPEYWAEAEKLRGEISTLDLILPEAYLESEKEAEGKERIAEKMKEIPLLLKKYENCMIYLERELPDGNIRRGLIGKVDLEEYDFSPDSASAIRATEQTVIERIPPRVAVRSVAEAELPHVMIFTDDTEGKIIKYADRIKESLEIVYDFELMLGGGKARGYLVDGVILSEIEKRISDYEENKQGVVYAMGDGNHSLASAKAHFENIKRDIGDAAMSHPARYALVEIVDLGEASIEFEPIYRLLLNCDAVDIEKKLEAAVAEKGIGGQAVMVVGEAEKTVQLPKLHPLEMGSLQMFLDQYLKENSDVSIDYIHGDDTLRGLCSNKNIGFLCSGVEKSELFSYVSAHGTLPRKTFSMGEARSKRYYLEARKIVK